MSDTSKIGIKRSGKFIDPSFGGAYVKVGYEGKNLAIQSFFSISEVWT